MDDSEYLDRSRQVIISLVEPKKETQGYLSVPLQTSLYVWMGVLDSTSTMSIASVTLVLMYVSSETKHINWINPFRPCPKVLNSSLPQKAQFR